MKDGRASRGEEDAGRCAGCLLDMSVFCVVKENVIKEKIDLFSIIVYQFQRTKLLCEHEV